MVKILLSCAIVLLAAVLCFACWMAGFTMNGKRQTLEEAWSWQSQHYDTSYYEKLEKEDYTISGENGYMLHVELLKNPQKSERYVILSHGYTDNRLGDLKYASLYLELGYNCILYDLRGHGLNEKTITTYGILEGKDLLCLISDTRKRYPQLRTLGLHGESLGAASSLSALRYKPEVDFVVSDCAFADIENVLRNGYKNIHAPSFLFELTDLGARLRYGLSLKAMRPLDALKDNTIPILFLHGEEDGFILPENAEKLYRETKGYKEICLIKGAGHALSVLTDPSAYQQYVADFLKKISE